ncbi:uncharacterized protein ARMOST_10236 [Armillaria ostoyae]|uniref:DUF6534 domain-containing protein n=1 Tax=Armillaria ostoyae TaxID=47428 RepID=A0A284RDQ9_ARMOS|nr:uncharacterized protein ARMOST_10236 [Armillaria ostoyae]
MTKLLYIPVLVSETIIALLTLFKGVQHLRRSSHPFLTELYVSGMFFYACLLFITLANILLPMWVPGIALFLAEADTSTLSYRRVDHLTSKTVVYVLWLTETVQSATNIYYTFGTFCYDFGNLSGLDDVDITWFTMPVLSGFVGCVAQLFYAWRMYKFSKKARWLCITLSVIAFAQFSAAICCGIEVRNSVHYSNLQKNSKVKVTAIIWLGGSALCDTAIALCMTYLLSRAQTGLKSTRILLSRLIRLTIETGTITAAIAAVHMAIFLAYHNNNFHTAPANCLVKVYSNTVLAVCNSRMTGRIRGGREDTTLHSFDSFDLSIGGLNIELRDTETNTNANSSLRPEFSQRSDDQEKSIGLNDRFLNTGSTADAVLGAKVRYFSPQVKQII